MSKINGGGCFKRLGFQSGLTWGNYLSPNQVQWNPSPLTPDWTPLHSGTHLAAPCPGPSCFHYFHGNVSSCNLTSGSEFTQLLCGHEVPPRCLSWLWYLCPLKPWRTLLYDITTQINIQHIFTPWQGQVLTTQKRASCVISPMIWWPSTLQQSCCT